MLGDQLGPHRTPFSYLTASVTLHWNCLLISLSLGRWLQKGREPLLSATVSRAQCLTKHRPSINRPVKGGAALKVQARITGPPSLSHCSH